VAPTLLLADDSITIQRVIELTFADEDVHVVAVSDGDEAIAALERTPPDIVLADVGMPGRSGYEVAQHIKDTPRLAHIPVVLLTGAFEPVDQAKAAAAGCDGVLAKPFEPQIVIGRVRELLSKRKGASSDAPFAPTIATSTSSGSDMEGGDYFEKLDQAFAKLSARPGGDSPPAVATPLDWFTPQHAPAAPATAIPFDAARAKTFDEGNLRRGTFDSTAATPAAPAADRRESAPPVARAESPLSHPPARPVETPPALPPLVDAFAALLAAEQASPTPAAAPQWPSRPPPVTAAAVNDDMVEAIVRRVLDELTDRVVRESVAERVDQIAERLVREEIERIKGSNK
jgi:CheY-like chemotaxis protein